ncbi:MAG: hypothetical protein ACYSTZ_06305 [Planctomycetota bacterium]|jgi:hypothetical protein
MNELFSIGLVIIIIVVICTIFIRISRKVRKGGGSGATIAILGSTYDAHSKNGKRAIETIVELKAGKKLEEQESPDSYE